MNNRMDIQKIKSWIKERTPREKLVMFGVGIALIYFFFNFIFLRPVALSEIRLNGKRKTLQDQTMTIQNQIKTITDVISQPSFREMLAEQKTLKSKAESMAQYLSQVTPNVIPAENIGQAMKDILSQQGDVSIISIKRMPIEPWIPKELFDVNLPASFKFIDKYALEIIFRSDYFKTLSYLERLEKLPWRIYWESFDYKVLSYPEAESVIKFHLLINQKATP